MLTIEEINKHSDINLANFSILDLKKRNDIFYAVKRGYRIGFTNNFDEFSDAVSDFNGVAAYMVTDDSNTATYFLNQRHFRAIPVEGKNCIEEFTVKNLKNQEAVLGRSYKVRRKGQKEISRKREFPVISEKIGDCFYYGIRALDSSDLVNSLFDNYQEFRKSWEDTYHKKGTVHVFSNRMQGKYFINYDQLWKSKGWFNNRGIGILTKNIYLLEKAQKELNLNWNKFQQMTPNIIKAFKSYDKVNNFTIYIKLNTGKTYSILEPKDRVTFPYKMSDHEYRKMTKKEWEKLYFNKSGKIKYQKSYKEHTVEMYSNAIQFLTYLNKHNYQYTVYIFKDNVENLTISDYKAQLQDLLEKKIEFLYDKLNEYLKQNMDNIPKEMNVVETNIKKEKEAREEEKRAKKTKKKKRLTKKEKIYNYSDKDILYSSKTDTDLDLGWIEVRRRQE